MYAALRWLPERLFNDARRLWEEGGKEAAEALLRRVLALRSDFPEAHWLIAVIEWQSGRGAEAQRSLERARSLGAKVDPAWLEAEPAPPGDTPARGRAEEPASIESCLAEPPEAGLELGLDPQ